MSYQLSYTFLVTPGVSKALAKVSSATPGSQWTGQAQARGQGQGQGREETWINVEQKQMQVQRAPLQYSTFVNQPARDIGMDIDPFDTTTPLPDPVPVPVRALSQQQFPVPVYGSEPKSRPRQDLIKVHDSGVVLQLSEVSSEPAQSQKGQGSEQGKDIPDDWEVVYPDE